MHRVLRRITTLAAVSAVGALGALPATSSAATFPIKLPVTNFAVTVAPATVLGGATTAMTATVTNETVFESIESAALFPPAPLTVVSASLPSGQQPVISTCKHAGALLPCVQLHDIDIHPGKSLVVTMSVSALPACTNAMGNWSAAARPDGIFAF